MDATTADPRRSSIDKTPIPPPPFDRLPDEIIEQILQLTDPNGFASLILLNRKWRSVSQRPHLYLHHLSQCPSYAASHPVLPTADDDSLPRLRRLFAREVKRNLYQAYLRPTETVIKLISNSISSSSAPGGEGMQFSASLKGHRLLAYNSARIYVIDTNESIIEVKRELKILRRPAAACINDLSTVLVVLSSEMQVDVYDLKQSPPRRTRSMILENTPRAIALSPCATVLAAAYEGGIEVTSLRSDALPTDRRSVKCDGVDALVFSFDGTQILGTTTQSSPPNTVILTAPYYDPGSHISDDNLSALWTTSILFPNTSRDCSHAVLLQDGSQEEACWAFTYDRSFETFRAVRIDDLRNGTTYFTGPVPSASTQPKLLPCTLPAATYQGELVSAGFQGKDVWIYGIPEDLDAVPDSASSSNDGGSNSSNLGRQNSAQSASSRRLSSRPQEGDGAIVPQWRRLCDKLRNTFVSGYKISELTEVSNVKWVAGFGQYSSLERLVITARGVGAPRLVTEEEDIDFVDGGRITILDFDYGVDDGTKTEISIEVGTDKAEVLEEEQRDLATDVAIVRRRTVAQKRGGRGGGLLRTTTAAPSRRPHVPPVPRNNDEDDDPLVPRRIGQNPVIREPPPEPTHDDDGEEATIEEMEALDAPYAHASPRSGTTLRRAATAAAMDRSLHPRTADGRRIEYRRADGRREHPHESDADGWVPPPPPYQKEDPGDLPAFMRGPSVAPLPNPVAAVPSLSRVHPLGIQGQSSASQGGSSPQRPSFPRTASDSTTMSRPRIGDTPRPNSSPSIHQETDDIYDVTPPDSPRRPTRHMSESAQTETGMRQTSASTVSSTRLSRAVTAPSDLNAPVSPIDTRRSSGESHVVPNSLRVPGAHPHISPATGSMSQTNQGTGSRARRLSNSQTWPMAPGFGSHQSTDLAAGYPYSVSAPQAMMDPASALPPPPSSGQLASLNKRISQGSPRRLSGGFQIARRPVGSSHSEMSFSRTFSDPVSPESPRRRPPVEFDQPLIISTPRGVTGAFDPPSRQISSRRNETPLLAPIPRHPRPTQTSSIRPTVERLETIYSTASSQGANQVSSDPAAPSQVPAWLNAPPVPVTRPSPNVNRRPSRAERSAAKNMKDAKKRGWTGKNKKKKKKHTDAASSAGWTDISTGSARAEKEKDKKCIVM